VKAFAIRRATGDDLPLVMDTWRSSQRMSHTAGPMPMARYRDWMSEVISGVLQRPGSRVLVACRPGEVAPHDVYGWIAVEDDIIAPVRVREHGRSVNEFRRCAQPAVHYVYVSQLYRGKGVARRLFAGAGVDPKQPFLYTFKTGTSAKLAAAGKVPGGWFDPRPVRFEKHETYETEEKTT